ncbi:hypothetical protein GLYMA_11G165400v4 [Glycine max]|nr:hypothetical protein GLYMA_11G165400v4 [Glycine max]
MKVLRFALFNYVSSLYIFFSINKTHLIEQIKFDDSFMLSIEWLSFSSESLLRRFHFVFHFHCSLVSNVFYFIFCYGRYYVPRHYYFIAFCCSSRYYVPRHYYSKVWLSIMFQDITTLLLDPKHLRTQ